MAEQNIFEKWNKTIDTEGLRKDVKEASENKGDASAAMQVGVNNCFDPNDLSNIILYGPPGTGKTFTMQGMVSALGDESLYMSGAFSN